METTPNIPIHYESQNPLWIPEIAQHVFRYSDQQDGCYLARSCRCLFNSLMPLLWENVRGAEQLLALIQGVGISTDPYESIKITVRIFLYILCHILNLELHC
jgi:hypothetical protein